MSKILILTPWYKAWDKTVQMIEHIEKNTFNDFTHVLVADSWSWPMAIANFSSPKRMWLEYNDGLPPEQHRANITKALQVGWDAVKNENWDYVFVVETDVMVPDKWDERLINLSKLINVPWETLDVIAVDEEDNVTYPCKDHNIRRGHKIFDGHEFEYLQYGDWNAVLLSPSALAELKVGKWRFDDVPTHHDILLSRAFRDRRGYDKENWDPPLFFRTQEVRAIHYPNSSRSELPEGLKTPSNPR